MLHTRLSALRSVRGDDQRAVGALVLTSALDLVADWAVLVALLALVYTLTDDVRVVALFLLARLLPRALLSLSPGVGIELARAGVIGFAVARVAAVASLIVIERTADLWWAWPVVLLSASAGVVLESRRCALLGALVPRLRVLSVNAACILVARSAFVGGALLSAGVLLGWSPRVVLLLSALVLAVAVVTQIVATTPPMLTEPPHSHAPDAQADAAVVGARLRHEPRLRLSVGSLFVSGLIAASMQLALVVIVFESFDRPHAMLGIMFACVAFGMLLGPLPIPKLLVRLSPTLLLAGGASALAVALAVAIHAPLPIIVLAVAFGTGLLAITNEELATLAVRRLVPGEQIDAALRLVQRGVTAGQLCALLGAVLVAELWVGDWTVIAIAGACLGLIGLLFLHAEGSDRVSLSNRVQERMRRA